MALCGTRKPPVSVSIIMPALGRCADRTKLGIALALEVKLLGSPTRPRPDNLEVDTGSDDILEEACAVASAMARNAGLDRLRLRPAQIMARVLERPIEMQEINDALIQHDCRFDE